MKQLKLILTTMLVICSSGLYAQIVNLSNMSAEWQRTGNRNAAIDAADIIFYNPAGLTKLADGIHINASNQTLIRLPEHTADYSAWGDKERTYSHEGTDWFLPDLYAAYKKDNWAVFTGFFIPAGGASVNYTAGSLTTQMLQIQANFNTMIGSGYSFDSFKNQSLEASSIYMGALLGGSYAINDIVSLAAGVRYIHVMNTTKVEVSGVDNDTPANNRTFKVDTEDTGNGYSGVIGVNITPLPELNIGMRYETVTKIELKTDVNRDDIGIAEDGEKTPADMPAVFGIGVAYSVIPELTLEADFTYYFQSQADWGKDDNGDSYSEFAGDCYGTGIAAVYKVNNEITASMGICYTAFLWDDEAAYYAKFGSFETLYSDNIAILIGGAYEVTKGIKINLAYNYTWWKSETIDFKYSILAEVPVKTENATHIITLGADCTF